MGAEYRFDAGKCGLPEAISRGSAGAKRRDRDRARVQKVLRYRIESAIYCWYLEVTASSHEGIVEAL